jgi:hypothetical protein
MDFAAQIHALSNFDADGTDDSISGEDFDEHAAQWMTDGAKEVITQLPSKFKEKCATATELDDSTTVMDMDSTGDILFVTRLSADSSGFYTPCRKIPSMYGGMAEPDSGHMFNEPSVTDPVYWIDANTSGSDGKSSTLYVKPIPTANQKAYVHHVKYPVFTAGDTETYDVSQKNIIANFPDEAEYLVVLYAAIKATEYMMLSEEDQEVYAPQLATLKQDYAQGLATLKGGQQG